MALYINLFKSPETKLSSSAPHYPCSGGVTQPPSGILFSDLTLGVTWALIRKHKSVTIILFYANENVII